MVKKTIGGINADVHYVMKNELAKHGISFNQFFSGLVALPKEWFPTLVAKIAERVERPKTIPEMKKEIARLKAENDRLRKQQKADILSETEENQIDGLFSNRN